MKLLKSILAAAAVTLACAAPAYADRGHAHVGVSIGVPLFSPYWGAYAYPPYPYYYPPVVVTPPTPQVYVEQQPAPAAATPAQTEAPENYWYYCAQSKTYFPYVKECAGPWQRVTPQPPAPSLSPR